MNDVQQLAAIATIVKGDKNKGEQSSSIDLAINEILTNTAQKDTEGQPCSIKEARRIFSTKLYDETNIKMQDGTVRARLALGRWLRESGNRAMLPDIPYAWHLAAAYKRIPWKTFVKNPKAFQPVTGDKSGLDVRVAEVDKVISHMTGCQTSVKRMVNRCILDADELDTYEDFAGSDELRRTAKLYEEVIPLLGKANEAWRLVFDRP